MVFDVVNLGVAVAVSDGLVVAVVRDADHKSLIDLSASVADLAQRARTGKLGMADIEGGTFTVSNLGMFGIDGGFPVFAAPAGGRDPAGRACAIRARSGGWRARRTTEGLVQPDLRSSLH